MKKTLLLLVVISFAASGIAQDQEKSSDSSSDLAKKLANPNATLGQMLFPIDYIHYNGDLEGAHVQNAYLFNFQPSLPIPLSQGLNLYVRPLIPFTISQPIIGYSGFETRGGLGNISADVAVGKTWPSRWVTLVGIFGGFPTATNESLRSSQVTLGPEFLVAKLTSFGALGIIVTHAWGVGDPSDPDPTSTSTHPDDFWIVAGGSVNASVTAGQYFYTVNLKKGWQINASPTYSYNHNGSEGNKFTFPIAAGAQKILKAGNIPIRLGLQYWYYVASPDSFAPQHQIRLTIAPVVPLPW